MVTDGNSLRLNCKKINIVLKHFANEYLSLLHDLYYTYHTGKTDEDWRPYVGDTVLLREEFVIKMKWRKGKVLKLIHVAELLAHNKNSEKTFQIKRPLQVIAHLRKTR